MLLITVVVQREKKEKGWVKQRFKNEISPYIDLIIHQDEKFFTDLGFERQWRSLCSEEKEKIWEWMEVLCEISLPKEKSEQIP